MLILPFKIEEDSFAIGINKIKEVIPIVEFSEIASSPDYVKGLINYRGLVCPLIDLSMLIKSKVSKIFLSTRIIIIELTQYNALFGLLAEKITETVFINPSEIRPVGSAITDAKYIDSTIILNGKIIQIINPEIIFSEKEDIFQNTRTVKYI